MKTLQVCKDFLRMQKGREFDAIEAARFMSDVWGIRVDWHDMGYALDELHRTGEATLTQPGGFCRYIIN